MPTTPCLVQSDDFTSELTCNLAAASHVVLQAVSLAGPERSISTATALLQVKKGSFVFPHLNPHLKESQWHKGVIPDPDGYTIYKHNHGYDCWQMLAVSKSKHFLLVDDEASLWRLLRSDLYTTPLLRDWAAPLREELRQLGLLKKCLSFGCDAATLYLAQEKLDVIVSEGIKAGRLTFGAQAAAAAA